MEYKQFIIIHLGSLQYVLDASGNILEEYSFDAWGRRRNPVTWKYQNVPDPVYFSRGYTGHEHLEMFGLINMNGRIYDPVLCRFLSPDNYVASPFHSQSYNRYSYALNNPLIYTDPSGEIIFTIIGAIFAPVTGGASLALGIAMDIGGGINLATKAFQGKINSVGDGLAAYGIGAAAGAIGYATGGAAFAAAGGAAGGAGGFLAGMVGGAVGSAYAIPVQSIGNSLYFGDPMMTPEQYALGIIGGGLLGGTINGTIAAFNGKTFWNGTVKPSNIGTPTPSPV
ncbi:MAG: RHS repeat domain-containing protein, partial [Bacteroidota bacterium]